MLCRKDFSPLPPNPDMFRGQTEDYFLSQTFYTHISGDIWPFENQKNPFFVGVPQDPDIRVY